MEQIKEELLKMSERGFLNEKGYQKLTLLLRQTIIDYGEKANKALKEDSISELDEATKDHKERVLKQNPDQCE